MRTKLITISFVIFLVGIFSLFYFQNSQEVEEENITSFKIAGKEFTLPSPIHTFTFLNESGFKWEGLGNQDQNIEYTLQSQIALQLGVRASNGVIFLFTKELKSAWDAREDVIRNAKKLELENQIKKSITILDRSVIAGSSNSDILENIIDIEISLENSLQKKGRDDLSLLIEMGAWIGGLEIVTKGLVREFNEIHTEVLHQSHLSDLSIEIFREIIYKTKGEKEKEFLTHILNELTKIHSRILSLENRRITKTDVLELNRESRELVNYLNNPK